MRSHEAPAPFICRIIVRGVARSPFDAVGTAAPSELNTHEAFRASKTTYGMPA